MPEPLRDSDPREVGGYALESRLGAGGMGTVYFARSVDGSRLAIKVLRPELADVPEIRRRLAREAEALKRLAGEYTARVFDVNAEADCPYFVMEYVPGLTLDKHVTQFGPVSGGLAWAVVDALVAATAQFHSEGVTHRDLKPSNVIVGPDGVKVIDFGVSRLAELASTTEAGAVTGTLTWSSPEQALGDATGAPSDVFNLGMIVAFAYSGRHPFGEGTPAALMYRIVHEEPDLAGLPIRLGDIVEDCLAKKAADRPTASEVLIGVRAISRSSSNQGAHSQSTNDSRGVERTLLVNVEQELGLQLVLTDEPDNYQDYKHAEEFGGQPMQFVAEPRNLDNGNLVSSTKLSLRKSLSVGWALGAVLIILSLALIGSYARSGYYVGFDGPGGTAHLVVFEGRPQQILWFQPTIAVDSGVERRDVFPSMAADIDNKPTYFSFARAEAYVNSIRDVAAAITEVAERPTTTSTTSVVAPDVGIFAARYGVPLVSIECAGGRGVGIAIGAQLDDPWVSYIVTAPDAGGACLGRPIRNLMWGPDMNSSCGAEGTAWLNNYRRQILATCEVETPLNLWYQMESTQKPQPGDAVVHLSLNGSQLLETSGVITSTDSNSIVVSPTRQITRGALFNSTGQLIGLSTSTAGWAIPITALDPYSEELAWGLKS